MIDNQYQEFLKICISVGLVIIVSISVGYAYTNVFEPQMQGEADVEYECSQYLGTYNATVSLESHTENVNKFKVVYDGQMEKVAPEDEKIQVNNFGDSEIKVLGIGALGHKQVIDTSQPSENIKCDTYSPS